MKRSDWPERNDLVVVRIKRIANYGATVELIEYTKKEGFVHISQVASGWVKNIRSHVSEGQMRVGKINRMDRERGTIDISFRAVSSQQEKRKNEDWKREKRADKLFEMICKDIKKPVEESYKEIAYVLEEEFGDLFSAFESASIYGEEALESVKIPDDWKKVIVKHSQESITAQEVTIKGDLILTSTADSESCATICIDTPIGARMLKVMFLH